MIGMARMIGMVRIILMLIMIVMIVMIVTIMEGDNRGEKVESDNSDAWDDKGDWEGGDDRDLGVSEMIVMMVMLGLIVMLVMIGSH